MNVARSSALCIGMGDQLRTVKALNQYLQAAAPGRHNRDSRAVRDYPLSDC